MGNLCPCLSPSEGKSLLEQDEIDEEGEGLSMQNSKMQDESNLLVSTASFLEQKPSLKDFTILKVRGITFVNKVIQLLGKGSFAKVHLAQRKIDGKQEEKRINQEREVICAESTEQTFNRDKKPTNPYSAGEENLRRHKQSVHSAIALRLPNKNKTIYGFRFHARRFLAVLRFLNKISGELFYHLKQMKTFSEDKAKFYAAEIVLAIEYLHKKNIIHR